ncbi:MAG: hypothetical protein H0W62_13350 [Chitinophagales bacterium]|nr:hypothetical protein [Chitinophagales bacterium]
MGYFESVVVIYLRELFYPNGFQFPLAVIPQKIAVVEFWREAATIIMLLMMGIIAGKNTAQRFSFFLLCFGVWDIFYYIFLKLLLHWPASLFTQDILFVIPVPWVGPVLAPCLVSLTMIVLTLCVVYYHEKDIRVTISNKEWLIFILGAAVVVLSFTWDYLQYISLNNGSIWTPVSQAALFDEIPHFIPQDFNWWLFSAGELFLIAGIFLMVYRHRKLTYN